MAANKYLDAFMKTFPYEGLTYDDVTLVTQYADFLPDDASLETQLTSRQKMKVPFISAAMDTVTEAPMAIAMALAGGIGVIHKNLEEDDQAAEVAKVKSYLNGLIAKPVCFHANDDISFLRAEKRRLGLKFNGFPVLDDQERLVGMITSGDMRYAPMDAMKLSDVMQKDPITAKPGLSLKKAYELMRANKIGKLPLVDKAGHVVGLYSFTDVQRLVENKNPTYNCDDQFRLRVSASVSGGKGDLSRMEKLAAAGVDVVVVDSVAALTPQAEIDGNMGDSHMGLQARLMSQAMRKLTSTIAATKTLLIFTNQVREKIGVMFGNPETTPGGKALKFYASCRLQVQRIGAIKNTAGQVVGNRTRVKVVKNKVAPPFTEAEFDILYTCGISYEGSVLDAALARGIVEKRGSWLSFGDEQLAQGSLATIDYLRANPEVTQKIVELVKTTPVNPALAKKK